MAQNHDDISELVEQNGISEHAHMQMLAYWEDVCHEPDASAACADAALRVANDLADLLIGRSWSLKGVAFAVGDDYANSELCFFKAANLLAAFPTDAAENWRRLGILRIKQGLLWEARELLQRALRVVQTHGSPNQLGKVFLALGFLETEFGSHEVAACFYGESLSHLDHSSRSFKIAAHNLMCAMVRSNDSAKLREAIFSLQRAAGDFHGDSAVRFKWIIAVAAIHQGFYAPGKNSLRKVLRAMKKRGSREELATVLIDLAQAYYCLEDFKMAKESLSEAKAHLSSIPGVPDSVLANIDHALEGLDSKQVEPWDVRHKNISSPFELPRPYHHQPQVDQISVNICKERVRCTTGQRPTSLIGQEQHQGALVKAESFLWTLLAYGPVPATEVKEKARNAGIAERTLNRAKDRIGVVSLREGFGRAGKWSWALPYNSSRIRSEGCPCR